MNLIVPFTGERIAGSLTLDIEENLLCDLSIWDERKTIKLENNRAFDPTFYKSDELVYVRIGTGQKGYGDSVEYNYINKVRRARVTVQKIGNDFHLLCFYSVRASTACIVSWIDSPRGNKLKSMEAIDYQMPIPFPIEED